MPPKLRSARDEIMAKRLTKNQLRREKAKKRKLPEPEGDVPGDVGEVRDSAPDAEPGVEQPVAEPADAKADAKGEAKAVPVDTIKEPTAPVEAPADASSSGAFQVNEELFSQFQHVFKRFQKEETQLIEAEDSDDSVIEYELDEPKVQKKQKVPMGHLKALTKFPQVVEWTDSDAPDPYILVSIKESLNVVPVPAHWSLKRDYLSSKRGIDRPPFQLPAYILETGIQDMRSNIDEQTLRQQQRDKVRPKLGKLDIDYQKLHDAFFKYQTKPKVLEFGDVFYEGRETAEDTEGLDDVVPGKLSEELLEALGLPKSGKTPPAWISIMNQIGKPAAYSHLLIPGIDMAYANVGYLLDEEQVYGQEKEPHWGEIEVELEEEEEAEELEEEEEREDQEGEKPDPTEPTYFEEEGAVQEVQEEIVVKKKENGKLYTVLKDVETEKSGLLGTEKSYVMEETKKEEQQAMPPKEKKFKF